LVVLDVAAAAVEDEVGDGGEKGDGDDDDGDDAPGEGVDVRGGSGTEVVMSFHQGRHAGW
jgi:hypothetical protein